MAKKAKRALNLIASNDYFRGAIQNIAIKNIGGIISFVATNGHILTILPLDSKGGFLYPEGTEVLSGKYISKEVWKIIASTDEIVSFYNDKIICGDISCSYAAPGEEYPDIFNVLPGLATKPDYIISLDSEYLRQIAKVAKYRHVQLQIYKDKIVVVPYISDWGDIETDIAFNLLMKRHDQEPLVNDITQHIKDFQLKEKQSKEEKENAGI